MDCRRRRARQSDVRAVRGGDLGGRVPPDRAPRALLARRQRRDRRAAGGVGRRAGRRSRLHVFRRAVVQCAGGGALRAVPLSHGARPVARAALGAGEGRRQVGPAAASGVLPLGARAGCPRAPRAGTASGLPARDLPPPRAVRGPRGPAVRGRRAGHRTDLPGHRAMGPSAAEQAGPGGARAAADRSAAAGLGSAALARSGAGDSGPGARARAAGLLHLRDLLRAIDAGPARRPERSADRGTARALPGPRAVRPLDDPAPSRAAVGLPDREDVRALLRLAVRGQGQCPRARRTALHDAVAARPVGLAVLAGRAWARGPLPAGLAPGKHGAALAAHAQPGRDRLHQPGGPATARAGLLLYRLLPGVRPLDRLGGRLVARARSVPHAAESAGVAPGRGRRRVPGATAGSRAHAGGESPGARPQQGRLRVRLRLRPAPHLRQRRHPAQPGRQRHLSPLVPAGGLRGSPGRTGRQSPAAQRSLVRQAAQARTARMPRALERCADRRIAAAGLAASAVGLRAGNAPGAVRVDGRPGAARFPGRARRGAGGLVLDRTLVEQRSAARPRRGPASHPDRERLPSSRLPGAGNRAGAAQHAPRRLPARRGLRIAPAPGARGMAAARSQRVA